MSDLDKQAVIVHGNVTEGFEFIGPFVSFGAAAEYADEAEEITRETWIARLEMPGGDRT